jgi:hypothetical protein
MQKDNHGGIDRKASALDIVDPQGTAMTDLVRRPDGDPIRIGKSRDHLFRADRRAQRRSLTSATSATGWESLNGAKTAPTTG